MPDVARVQPVAVARLTVRASINLIKARERESERTETGRGAWWPWRARAALCRRRCVGGQLERVPRHANKSIDILLRAREACAPCAFERLCAKFEYR